MINSSISYRFHYFLSFLTLVWIIGVVGCNRPPPPEELTSVKVGFTTVFLGEAATYTALEQGFFTEHGLEVTLKHNPAGKASLRDLLHGKVDIAHAAETPIVHSLLDSSYYQMSPIPSYQIFADMIYADEVQQIIGRKDHNIKKPRDMIGKRVAIYKDTQLDYYLDSFLLEHQIPKNSISLIDMAPSDHIEAIEKGEVDISVNWEPFASNIQRELGENAITLESKLTYSTLWLATTLDSYAKENPEVLEAYLKALKQAQDYIKIHPQETQKLLADKTNTSFEVVENLWQKIDYELSLSERMLLLLEDQARWLEETRSTDTTNINFNDLINFNPMREVHPDGITVIQ